MLYATVDMPLFGDGVVLKSSALYQRPGGNEARVRVTNSLEPYDCSALHIALPSNQGHSGVSSWSRTGSRVTRSRAAAQAAPRQ